MRVNPLTALRITLASPEQIRSWSWGEVMEPTTINYLTGQPEPDGLFSERIFGPTKDWACTCGKYRRERSPGFKCEQCGVEITKRTVRRERMGHIELASPVAHPWYTGPTENPIALLLDLSPRKLASVLSYESALVLSIDEELRQLLLMAAQSQSMPEQMAELIAHIKIGDVIDPSTALALSSLLGPAFRAKSGAEAVRERLLAIDLDALANDLREQLTRNEKPSKHIIKRLAVVEAFRTSGVQPAWMILTVLPVLPPELRPLVPIDSGRFATSDLNTLYERVLHRNQRLKQLAACGAPEIILKNEKRLLQQTCNALLDNGHQDNPVKGSHKQPLLSLTDRISGKHGRFRYNLLGKRVDYSGRSVIVGDPTLSLHECGLPTKICLELFKPLLIRKLLARNIAETPRAARRMIERTQRDSALWDVLEEVMYEELVLLNRAPTLHRLSIQAFFARRVEGSAIRLHPLVCSAFNADFDGDQMAVHLPLSRASQREAYELLLSIQNMRNPQNGEPSISISQEMVLGLFYLTQDRPSQSQTRSIFADGNEAQLALTHGKIDLHTPITIRIDDPMFFDSPTSAAKALPQHRRITTTAGRLIFNEALPIALRYRNYELTKEAIKLLIAECLERFGSEATAQLADGLKQLGVSYATKSGISFAISDIPVPPEKQMILTQADSVAASIEDQYRAGMITNEEQSRQLIDLWTNITDVISSHLEASLSPYGSLATIIKSGATKAKFQQIRQLSGIRGLMARPNGTIIDIPIRGNYLQGLNIREMFIAASAARNGFMGRSLNTATTGYLTRRLVEAGMEVWVTMQDCGTDTRLLVTHEESQAAGLSDFRSSIRGRILAEQVASYSVGTLITPQIAEHIFASGIEVVSVRSVLTCQAPYGVCQQCYGADLSTGELVRRGTAVGIIAGQSIGEPGTQLSMKAFHSGGIANAAGDIRGGLPRVIELFEARSPAGSAPIAQTSGIAHVEQDENSGTITIHIGEQDVDTHEGWRCTLPPGQIPCIQSGQWCDAGTPLAAGALDPHELITLLGREPTARYLITEIQRVFRTTGVTIHDKHLECIVRQMLRYIRVENPGDTILIPGTILDRFHLIAINKEIWAQGGERAVARPVLLGLTRTVLQTSSWLAAASFQETSRVLRDAALWGKRDDLVGFKERVITGLRLPAQWRTTSTHV